MFTKCPSCRTEISFEPPSNAPSGYKHRIKCPNPACGVTISVALPSKQAAPPTVAATGVPVGTPSNTPEAFEQKEAALVAQETSGKVKYKGRARSFVMLIFSLIFVALNVVSYLISTGKMAGIEAVGFVSSEIGSAPFNGIAFFIELFKDFSIIQELFVGEFLVYNLVLFVLPPALLLVAAILAISNLIGFIAGKYGKTGNVIFSLLTLILSVGVMFQLFIIALLMEVPIEIGPYLKAIVENALIYVIAVGVAFVFFIFSIIFAAKKKKAKEPKIV